MKYLRRLRCALTDHDRETFLTATVCTRCDRIWFR